MSLWSLTLLVSGLAPAAYRDSRDNRGTLHIVISISRSEVRSRAVIMVQELWEKLLLLLQFGEQSWATIPVLLFGDWTG